MVVDKQAQAAEQPNPPGRSGRIGRIEMPCGSINADRPPAPGSFTYARGHRAAQKSRLCGYLLPSPKVINGSFSTTMRDAGGCERWKKRNEVGGEMPAEQPHGGLLMLAVELWVRLLYTIRRNDIMVAEFIAFLG